MKNLQYLKSLVLLLVVSICVLSCSTEELKQPENYTNITVKLKSTIGQLHNVYIDVEDVQLKVLANDGVSSEWKSLHAINSGIYNLYDLSEHNPLLLVDDLEIEADFVYEIRLVLGDNNFMEINNVLHSLDVYSLGNALPSNLIQTQLNSKRRYDVTIEFDIDQSVSFDESENTMVLDPKLYTAIRQIEY